MPALHPRLFSATRRYRPLFQALREAGIDVAPVLAELGLSEAQLLDPSSRIPRERAVGLFRRLLELDPTADLGLAAASRFRLTDLGALGYLLRHAAHPLAALKLFERYARLLADAATSVLQIGATEVTIELGMSGDRKAHPQGVDYAVGTLVRIIDELSTGRARPHEVRLSRPLPARIAPCRALFGENVRFDAPVVRLRYPEDALRVACPHSDPQLLAILEQHAQQLLDRLPATCMLTEQLRSVIEQQLSAGELSLGHAADHLGLSERTLRRKLVASGCSYRELLDVGRREHALVLLQDGTLGIGAIAQRLGFGDTTAFTRSFRRWTGRDPSSLSRGGRAVRS